MSHTMLLGVTVPCILEDGHPGPCSPLTAAAANSVPAWVKNARNELRQRGFLNPGWHLTGVDLDVEEVIARHAAQATQAVQPQGGSMKPIIVVEGGVATVVRGVEGRDLEIVDLDNFETMGRNLDGFIADGHASQEAMYYLQERGLI